MTYRELSDREKLDVIEGEWYKEAQSFGNAPNPVVREDAAIRSDILLDAYLEIAHELGELCIERGTE